MYIYIYIYICIYIKTCDWIIENAGDVDSS